MDERYHRRCHNRSAIRDPALRVLKLLGANINLQPTAVPDPPSQPPPPPPVSVNLLDFDDDDTLTSQANVAPLPANAPSTSINKVTSSLFGGLNIQSTPAPTADTQNLKDGAAETVEHEKPQFFDGATIKTDTAAPKLQDNQLVRRILHLFLFIKLVSYQSICSLGIKWKNPKHSIDLRIWISQCYRFGG